MPERVRTSSALSGASRLVSAWLPVLLLESLVLYLSSRPHLSLPTAIPHLDKAAHFTEYALLGWLLYRALAVSFSGGRGALVSAIVLVALLGAGDELFQGTVPGRDSTPLDWLGDLLGGATGVIVSRWYRDRKAEPAVSTDTAAEGTDG